MKKAIKFMSAVALVLVIAMQFGCLEAMKLDVYNSAIKQSSDPYMLQKFDIQSVAAISANINPTYGPWFVSLLSNNINKKANYEGGLNALQQAHLNFDPTADVIGRKYIEAAKGRGSSVKVYRPDVNETLIKIAARSASALGYNTTFRKFSNWDNALLEIGKDGRIISALARQQQVYTGSSNIQDMYSVVIFAEGIRQFENMVGNNVLTNGYLRDVN